jgi:hypothetical protein
VSFRPAVVLAVASLAAACGSGDSLFASFESRCARLASPPFEVVTTPVAFERDDTQPMALLTAKSAGAFGTHQAIGLTTAVFGQSTDIDLRVVDDRRGPACGMPRIRVALSMQPVTVFVARELAESPCEREVTLSHEMKHVAVFRDVLVEAAGDLQRAFPEVIGAGSRRAQNAEELQQGIVVSVRDYLARFMSDWQSVLDARQAEVDSPDEYARVSMACGHPPVLNQAARPPA